MGTSLISAFQTFFNLPLGLFQHLSENFEWAHEIFIIKLPAISVPPLTRTYRARLLVVVLCVCPSTLMFTR